MGTVTRFFRFSRSHGHFKAAVVHTEAEPGLTACGRHFRLGETSSAKWTHYRSDSAPTCARCRRIAKLPPMPLSYRHEDY
jgi:hypothetical protein